ARCMSSRFVCMIKASGLRTFHPAPRHDRNSAIKFGGGPTGVELAGAISTSPIHANIKVTRDRYRPRSPRARLFSLIDYRVSGDEDPPGDHHRYPSLSAGRSIFLITASTGISRRIPRTRQRSYG